MNNFLETPADNLQLSVDNIIFCKLRGLLKIDQ